MGRRSDPCWDLDGPEYDNQPDPDIDLHAVRMERLWLEELKTRLIENNTQMLVDVLKGMKGD